MRCGRTAGFSIFSVSRIRLCKAPMAGAMDTALAVGVARAGGLGSLPAGMLSGEQLRAQTEKFREEAPGKPLNLNFFAHDPPVHDNARANTWHDKLVPYYQEFGLRWTSNCASFQN